MMIIQHNHNPHTQPDGLSDPIWVFWRWEERNGQNTKVPHDPKTGYKAKSNDPSTWNTYEECANEGDGMGFMLSEDDSLAVVDIDDCRDTAGDTDPAAMKIVEALDSYTEVSPSGTGLHIILRGIRPHERETGDGPHGGKIELFDGASTRFITFTGNNLEGTSATINNRQKEFVDLYHSIFGAAVPGDKDTIPMPPEEISDDEIIGKLNNAKNGDAFRKLFYVGDISGYENDDSRGDMALAGMIVFYTGGDVDRAEWIIEQSALSRDKYEREDYLPRTIEKSLKGRDEFYVWERTSQLPNFPRIDLGSSFGKLDRRKVPTAISFSSGGRPSPRLWIVDKIIPENFPSMIYGGGGKAKSFLAAHLGHCVADPDCAAWMDRRIQTAPVLFVDFELGEDEQRRRAYDLAAGRGQTAPPADFNYLDCVGYPSATAFGAAYDICRELSVKLVIIDSVGMAMAGDAEKANDTIAFYREYISPLQDSGCAVLLIDHQAKNIKGEKYADKKAFGSVYKENLARSVFQLNGDWNGGVLRATLRHTKANLGPRLDDTNLTIAFEESCVTVELDSTGALASLNTSELVLRDLEVNGPGTAYTIAKRIGVKEKDVLNRLTDLRDIRVQVLRKEGRCNVWGTRAPP